MKKKKKERREKTQDYLMTGPKGNEGILFVPLIN